MMLHLKGLSVPLLLVLICGVIPFESVYQPIRLEVTAYTDRTCGKEPGDPAYGITASGAKTHHGALAADGRVPFGTPVFVPGYGWGAVEDRGRLIEARGGFRRDGEPYAGLDVWFERDEDANAWGRAKSWLCWIPIGVSWPGVVAYEE